MKTAGAPLRDVPTLSDFLEHHHAKENLGFLYTEYQAFYIASRSRSRGRRECGREGGRTVGRTDGRTGGRNDGRTDGREGRAGEQRVIRKIWIGRRGAT